jgi:hypothetical protein
MLLAVERRWLRISSSFLLRIFSDNEKMGREKTGGKGVNGKKNSGGKGSSLNP